MLSTNQKGAIAETAITALAIRLGIDVYAPVVEGGRYDLILDVGTRLLRVQCKWAVKLGDVVLVRCYSSRRAAEGMRVRKYTPDEVDAIGGYCAEMDAAYLLPPELFARRRQVHLRLGRSRNNQVSRVNWAEDYDFAATLARYGAVAQLGERLAGSQKATGSSPVGSTRPGACTRLFEIHDPSS